MSESVFGYLEFGLHVIDNAINCTKAGVSLPGIFSVLLLERPELRAT